MKERLLSWLAPWRHSYEPELDEILVTPPEIELPETATIDITPEAIALFSDELARLVAPQFADLLMRHVNQEVEQRTTLSALEAVLRQHTPTGRPE